MRIHTPGGTVLPASLIAAGATTGAASGSACSRIFPARPDQVRQARRFLAQTLGDSAVAADAQLCLSEIASNAVLHSMSRLPGGTFTARVAVRDGCLHVGVEDQGGSWRTAGGRDGLTGRGLLVVEQLADDWGVSGDGVASRIVWFEMSDR